MAKSLQVKSNWDYATEVIESKAAVDRYVAAHINYRNVSIALMERFYRAYKALEPDLKVGRPVKGSTGPTVTQFCEDVGVQRNLFYRVVERAKALTESGEDFSMLPGDTRIAELPSGTSASPREAELEKQLEAALLDEQSKMKEVEATFVRQKADITELSTKVRALNRTIARLEKQEMSPAMTKAVADLEKRREKLESEVALLTAVGSFSKELKALISAAARVSSLSSAMLEVTTAATSAGSKPVRSTAKAASSKKGVSKKKGGK